MKKIIFSLLILFAAITSLFIYDHDEVSAATFPSDTNNVLNGYVFGLNTSNISSTCECVLVVFDYEARQQHTYQVVDYIYGVNIGSYSYQSINYDLYYFDIRYLVNVDLEFESSGEQYQFYFGVIEDNEFYPTSPGSNLKSIDINIEFTYYTNPHWCGYLGLYNVFLSSDMTIAEPYIIERIKNPGDIYDIYMSYCSNYYYFAIEMNNAQYSNGYNQGYSNGNIDGYNRGYDMGVAQSNNNSYQAGYNQAYEDYYQSRYDLGRATGIAEGRLQNNWLAVGLLSLVDIPFNVFRNIFNFDLFGFNLYSIILTLATIGLILWLLKKFFRKD